jgi:hypothetical protein
MTHIIGKTMLILSLAAAGWIWDGEMQLTLQGVFVPTAEAVVGAPATPVSYAGVARRTTVRAVTPGVGAPGPGVTPGPGVGAPGPGVAPANLGGPVNRVGVR